MHKAVTIEDVEGVMGLGLRNNLEMATHPGGVAVAIVSVARLNQQAGMNQ